MADTILIKGEDRTLPVTLIDDNKPYVVTGATTVTAVFRTSIDDETTTGSSITVVTGTAGSNWAGGLIMVVVTAANSATMTAGSYIMEVSVTESGGDVRKFLITEDSDGKSHEYVIRDSAT